MNTFKLLVAATVSAAMFSCTEQIQPCGDKLEPASDGIGDIRLNQLGYFPGAEKSFVVVNSEATCFEIKDTAGKLVFSGSLVDKGLWDKSNEKLKVGIFDALTKKGSYTISVPDKGDSYPFDIADNIYADARKNALKTYYYQRASTEITEEFGGKYKRPMGQPDDTIYFHESTGKSQGFKNGSKGWYDAGDFNKYIVNTGVTVGTLYLMYEMFPQLYPDNYTNIPESGNGVSDLLDEVRWEMDWVYTMQDDDGGVFVKISELDWEWSVMPHEWVKDRYFIGKSTSASLNFAAMCAMVARVYKDIDADFAKKNIGMATKAWNWATANDTILYLGTPGVGSGNYDDTNLVDEFMWAASEMYVATGEQEYFDYLTANYFDPKFEVCGWRTFMSNIGFYSLLSTENGLPAEMKTKLKNGFVTLADGLVDTVNAIAYNTPSEIFEWGSNSEMMNRLIIVGFAYELTKDKKYMDAIVKSTDYFLGKNALGYSFLTGYGEKPSMHPHHRQSYADGIDDPIPGFITGGPNNGREDDVIYNAQNGGAKTNYPVKLPAVSYVDEYDSYASNEVTINWNSSLLMLFSMIEAHENIYAVKE